MKKFFIALGVLAALRAGAQSGSEAIMKARAKALVKQNNNRYMTPPQAPARVPPPAAPQAPQMTAAQQAFFKFETDMAAIKTNAAVTAAQKQSLADDLAAAATGANRPSQASLSKLCDDLTAALPQKRLSPLQRAHLAQEITVIVGGGQFPATQQKAIIGDTHTILGAPGADANAAAVSQDLENIAAELQKGASK
jgi:hypothetical protein